MPDYFESGVFTDNKAAWHGAGIVREEEGLTVEKVFELVPQLASDVIQVPMFLGAANPGPMGAGPQYPLVQMPNHFATVSASSTTSRSAWWATATRSSRTRTPSRSCRTSSTTVARSSRRQARCAEAQACGSCCKLPDDIVIGGVDTERLETYILVSNSHDGSSAVTVAIVTVRVVCANTLTMALNTAPRTFKIRHTASVEGKVTEARKALDISFSYVEEMKEVGDQLLQTSFSDDEFNAFLKSLVPDVTNKDGELSKNPPKVRAQIAATCSMTDDLTEIRGTKWGALQSVAAYVDHKALYKSSRTATAEENRFESLTSGSNLTAKAATLLLA